MSFRTIGRWTHDITGPFCKKRTWMITIPLTVKDKNKHLPTETQRERGRAGKNRGEEDSESDADMSADAGSGDNDLEQAGEDQKLQVADEVKKVWEREQLALKRRVDITDVAWWARLHVTPDNATKHPDIPPLKYLGGVDISFVKGDNVNACAALVVVELPSLEVVYEDCSHVQLTAPYIPGFLAFREAQFLVDKVRKLEQTAKEFMPQVILTDGNGLLHPREFGIACHLGVLLDLPTLGAAKKLFQVDGLEKNEEHKRKIQELKKAQDSFPLITDSGRLLGMALRSNEETHNPIYVSPGHQLSVETAVWVVNQCCPYRVPEPIRQADLRSREFLRQMYPEDRPEQQPKQKNREKSKGKNVTVPAPDVVDDEGEGDTWSLDGAADWF